MPIYKYKCSGCHSESEFLLPIKDGGKTFNCKCGGILERLVTVPSFRVKQSGKDKVLDTLNREYKILPPQQVEIMAGGLDSPKVSVIGKGF